ncbi:MAG: hypothetical protein R3A80_07735 [Bdellovibrionota bacterium]
MNFENFKFINMEASEDLVAFANRTLDRLREAAPYLTTFMPSLEYDSGKYTCTIELYSHWGHFSATSSTYIPEAAIVWTEHKINSQLWSWKEKRFSNLDDENAFLYQKISKKAGGTHRGSENRN